MELHDCENHVLFLLCLSVNAIPLGTCEKAKACEIQGVINM